MHLNSNVFTNNGIIPSKYTCDGDNISPPLSWDDPPEHTASFALLVEDPDAPRGTFTHWVIYDVPGKANHLLEGLSKQSTLPQGGRQGRNDFGQLGFGGPCPPHGNHRYFFKLFALDQTLDLAPGASKGEVLDAMSGHVLETAELMGHYARQ
jgi:hypothetical protein